MIKKFFSNRNRPGWKYDTRRKKYFSWGFDIRLADGRRKREPGFLSQAEAEAVVARIRLAEKDLRYGFLTSPKTLPTLSELAEKHIAKLISRKEQVRARRVLKTLREEIPEGLKVNELLTKHIDSFVDRRRNDGLVATSIDRELNIISSALNSAVNYYPELKNWNAPKIPRPKHSKRRRERVIKAAEVAKLLTWLYGPQRHEETNAHVNNRRNVGHVFRVALLTGARKGELCKLRWSQVDWGAMVMQIIGTKSENRTQQTVRYLQITRPIAEILNERLAIAGDFIFTRAGKEVTDYYEIMREASAEIGIAYGRDVIGGFVTHDARHTAVTRMLQAGCDLATIGSITGHQDKTLILRYGHASTESRDRAMKVLEKFAGNENLGLGLDAIEKESVIYSVNQKGVVPEVGRKRRKA